MADLHKHWVSELTATMGESEAQAAWRIWIDFESRNTNPAAGIEEVIVRLKKHEPLQYIIQETWFYHRAHGVSAATLIPRPETEELCWLILKDHSNAPLKLADVCTGSGCIANTLLAERNNWHAIASDFSAAALEIAEQNAANFGHEGRIAFLHHHFLSADFQAFTGLDLIVSNPPYVARHEATDMAKNVLDWEPHMALFPEHEDVLIFYRRLAELLAKQQNSCVLWAEINPIYAAQTAALFEPMNVLLITDMSGKQRFIRVNNE